MSTTSKKPIEYGTVELDEDEFHPKNIKVRVTMFLDSNILAAFKQAATKRGMGYQTLINETLRGSIDGLGQGLVERMAELEDQVQAMFRILKKFELPPPAAAKRKRTG